MRSRVGLWISAAHVLGCGADAPGATFFGALDGEAARPTDSAVAPREAAAAPVMDAGPRVEVGRLVGFLEAHNEVRARLASNPALAPLAWSEELATVAQAYAERLAAGCLDTLEHSPSSARNGWGENLASYGLRGGTGLEANGTARGTVELWESELSCYTYGPFAAGTNATCTAACERYGGCGHYTQLVWRDTQRVGCGVADCNAGGWRKSYWVCNYDPTGNFLGQLPY